MNIKDMVSTITHGRGPTPAPASNHEGEAKNTGQNQSNTSTGISSDIKIDSTRLPEPARSAPAHAAQELLAIQEVATDAEAPKNFGQLVAKIANNEQTNEPEESSILQAGVLSSAATDDAGS